MGGRPYNAIFHGDDQTCRSNTKRYSPVHHPAAGDIWSGCICDTSISKMFSVHRRGKRNSEKENGSSLHAIPPNRHHDDGIASWEEKGERGHPLTCVISMKKLDDCSLLQLVSLPTFLLRGPFPPYPGTSVNDCMRCSDITV
ncbi:hypothetical protein TNCV_2369851 [Trichonephila clavipes]|nr:hypothetical protein TNCV_2369851 [Trichonephila clavipes]